MKLLFTFFATSLFFVFISSDKLNDLVKRTLSDQPAGITNNQKFAGPLGTTSATSDLVVLKALAFEALLTSSQITTLQQTFTTALAQNWSNLPCGSSCRNGIQFGTLTDVQLTAAKEVIAAAAGTAVNEGYDEFIQIVTADSILNISATAANASAYGKGLYYISFLNAPTTTGAWMLQFGGHHYAANIAFNGGNVVGVTPRFEGVEPKSFTAANGNTYAPIDQEHTAMVNMLASLSTTELASAKLSQTFSDVLLGPNQDGNFPATKVGVAVSTLSTAQQALVLAAMQPWLNDADTTSAATLLSTYQSELAATYIAYSTDATLSTNTAYARIDGPSVWIEFVCQNGVVFQNQIHYHTVWRDHTRDYGNYLTSTTLPLGLINFDVTVQNANRIVSWVTADEKNVSYFSIERTADQTKGFVSIAKVNANNNNKDSYTYTDNQTSTSDVWYYRLKIVDLDGGFKYSKVVAIKNNAMKAISIYPNPVSNQLTIALQKSSTNVTIKVINNDGQVVIKKTDLSGSIFYTDISKLQRGSYFVRVEHSGEISTYGFIKN